VNADELGSKDSFKDDSPPKDQIKSIGNNQSEQS